MRILPVLLDKVPTAAAGRWRLLASETTDVAVAAHGGLLPDLESAKWGRADPGPDAGADHGDGCSMHGHVADRELASVQWIKEFLSRFEERGKGKGSNFREEAFLVDVKERQRVCDVMSR